MKKIAVLMASYNGEKYIREQIDSLLNQKDVIVEILIRDDGSTDSTIEILNEYQNKGQLNWYQGEHLNVAKGFMELVKNSPHADYYAFCDQDDVWLEDKLISAANKLDKEDSTLPLMYYCATTLVDQDLNFIAEHHIHENRSNLARFIFNDMSGNTIVFNNKLRELLQKTNNADITIHDKWTLQVCLACGGICVGDKNTHILYRQHGNNTIGMELSLLDKINKFIRVINLSKDIHFKYLNKIYGQNIVSPYISIVNIANNDKSTFYQRLKIAFHKDVVFDNTMFKLAYILHVLKGNL